MGARPLQWALWVGDAVRPLEDYGGQPVIVPVSKSENSLSPTILQSVSEAKVLAFHATVRLSKFSRPGENLDWLGVEKQLGEAVEWSVYVGARMLVVNPVEKVPESCYVQFARVLLRVSCRSQECEIVLRCRFLDEWNLWYVIKQLGASLWTADTNSVNAHRGIKRVCVSLDAHYPNCPDQLFQNIAARWLGEDVAMLLCTTTAFKANQQGLPSMVKRNRQLVETFLRRDLYVVLEMPAAGNSATTPAADTAAATIVSAVAATTNTAAPATPGAATAVVATDFLIQDVRKYIEQTVLWLQYTHHQLPPLLPTEISRGSHHDYLQEPLQPLADNLTAYTYSVFEEDRIKYDLYRAAIKEQLVNLLQKALLDPSHCPAAHQQHGGRPDLVATGCTATGSPATGAAATATDSGSGSSAERFTTVHIAYLGGGRGPLMQECFDALMSLGWRRDETGFFYLAPDSTSFPADGPSPTGGLPPTGGPSAASPVPASSTNQVSPVRAVRFSFSVVEKNPCAALVLRQRVLADPCEWWRDVEVVETDMREWRPRLGVDLVVSELLGSVGDNELSPECLWPVYRSLTPQGAVVPLEHTSYFAPIAASKLHRQLATESSATGAFDAGYVVDLYNYTTLAQPALPAFRFSYKPDAGGHGPGDGVKGVVETETKDRDVIAHYRRVDEFNRFARLRWTIQSHGEVVECHGFAGYFSSLLSPSVICSIAPHDESRDMDSWYPLYLPVERSLRLEDGDELELHIWRVCDISRVWYEWLVQVQRGATIYYISRIHNWAGCVWNFRK
ncbi:methyltransferase [Gregarina niphandrodes]|uniref:Protein arginine N-methyltransferase n=1 Tax=Gregarina niphandrodes TaxID=110365 RepID=A0A023AYJ6_GRENI|nr:methyltransferase [Gregarina niphandrodes]EZG43724.1 methyltransferase [Gregarina niphandrodes]|eukprot:XP_011133054.1 methyltransferase [Gregarina niphandrodes]